MFFKHMSSKHLFSKNAGMVFLVVLAGVFSVVLTSCKWQPGRNLSVGEANKKSTPIQVKLNGLTCLSEIDKSIDNYLHSRLNNNEILAVGQCVQEALRKFEYYSQDSGRKDYSANAVADFLNREYLVSNKLTASFVREIMNLKVLVIGGEVTSLTRRDLSELTDLISLITEEAIKNAPYIKIYLYNPDEGSIDFTNADLAQAKAQIHNTSRVIGKILSKNGRSYSVKSLEGLLSSAALFFKWDTHRKETISIDKLIPLVVAAKQLLGAKDADKFETDVWPRLLDLYATGYGIYLDYSFNLKNRSILYQPALDYFIENVGVGFDLLKRVIFSGKSKDRSISVESINYFIKNLVAVGLWRSDIKVESLQPIVARLGFRGFGLKHLDEFKSEFNLWANIQRHLNSASQGELDLKLADETASNELDFLKKGFAPYFKINDSRMYVLPKSDYAKEGLKYDLSSLSKLNLIRAGVRIFMRNFAAKKETNAFAGLTESELVLFYDTVRPLAIDMGLFDPRKANYGSNLFLEGSLFTFTGDGFSKSNDVTNKNYLDFYEISDLISLILSGGAVKDLVYDRVIRNCRSEGVKDGPIDVFGKAKIERACFLKYFAGGNFQEISNLPYMMRAVQKSIADSNNKPNDKSSNKRNKPSGYDNFILNLQEIAFIKCEDQKYIEQSEIAAMMILLHYTEVLFSVFDRDKSNYFDGSELMSAYYRFNEFLNRTITDLKKEEYEVSMLKSIYLFLIKNKKFPTSILDYLELKNYEYNYFNDDPNQYNYVNQPKVQDGVKFPEVKASRFDIIQILKILFENSSMTHEQSSCLSSPAE